MDVAVAAATVVTVVTAATVAIVASSVAERDVDAEAVDVARAVDAEKAVDVVVAEASSPRSTSPIPTLSQAWARSPLDEYVDKSYDFKASYAPTSVVDKWPTTSRHQAGGRSLAITEVVFLCVSV